MENRIICVPSYVSKDDLNNLGIKVDATVEAEYGEKVLEGDKITLAHHVEKYKNCNAPCNRNVEKLKDGETIVISHIDLDTIGGCLALLGVKPEDEEFWKGAEFIDIKGNHHIKELPKEVEDKINAYSAQIAFFIILSIIPFLMVFSSMLQYTSITEDMVFEIIERVMPQYVAPFLVTLVKEIYTRSMGIISVTAIIAIWSAAKGIQYMADGLNAVHELKETRNWFVLRFWAVIYTIVFLVAIVFTLVVLVFGNSLRHLAADYLPFIAHLVKIIIKFRGLIMLLLLILFFDVIFTALPNTKLTFKSQLPGATACAAAWYVFSFGLSIYVDYFNGFSMYGSLTTIALIMLWLYFCMYIMMMTVEFNVFLEAYRNGSLNLET